MELKEGFKDLLKKGYSVINDLNRSSDMAPKQNALKQNGIKSQNQARELIINLHQLVNAFDKLLQASIFKAIDEKMVILNSHSNEITQCVDYMSKLCLMAENMIKEDNLEVVSSFGPEVQEEFLKILKECRELKMIDYDTFTSLDLEVDLSGLLTNPLVNIVSWNPHCLGKEIVHSLGFGNIEDISFLMDQPKSDRKCPPKKDLGYNSSIFAKSDFSDIKESKLLHPQAKECYSSDRNLPTIKSPWDNQPSLLNSSTEKVSMPSLQMTQPTIKSPWDNQPSLLNSSTEKVSMPSLQMTQPTIKSLWDNPSLLNSSTEKVSIPSLQMTQPTIKSLWDNPSLLNSSTEKVSMPSLQMTQPPYTGVPFCNIPNRFPSPGVSARSGTHYSVANQNSPFKQMQNSLPNKFAYTQDQSQFHTSPTINVPNHSNMMMSNTLTHALKHMEIESEINNTVSTVQPSTDNHETPEHGLGHLLARSLKGTEPDTSSSRSALSIDIDGHVSPRFAASGKTDAASSNTYKFTSVKGENVPASSLPEKCNSRVKEVPEITSVPWHLSDIKPLEMKFDLRNVFSIVRSGVPEIFCQLVNTLGDADCPFFHPIGVTVTVDGLVVVADTFNHVVKVLSNNKLVMTLGDSDEVKFRRPSAVVTDKEGNIYVKDESCINIFNRNGKLLHTLGKAAFSNLYGLAITQINNEPVLVVINIGKGPFTVYHYYIKRDQLRSYCYAPPVYNAQISKIRFLAVHNNSMLVSDLGANTMYLSQVDGKMIKAFGGHGFHIGKFKEPSGIAADGAGNWIVADSRNNRLQAFTNDGQVLATIRLSTPIYRPSGIHLTSDGHLYVINYNNNKINVYELRKRPEQC